MSDQTTLSTSLSTVKRRALERALVDERDARRHFALAGALDAVSASSTSVTDESDGGDTADVLSVALLSVAAVRAFETGRTDSVVPPSPWTPGDDASHPAVRRGAQLALESFDLSAAQVAARAGVPEAALVTDDV